MLIALREVSIAFGARQVLRGVSCMVAPGRFVALVGPSGSGKSTLLAVLGGVLRPDHGERLERREAVDISWMSQSTVLLRRRSALDNVAIGAYRSSRTVAEARAVAERSLALAGLDGLARHRASTLSGGEQQRVAVARALAGRPDLVLADEPTASLDAAARTALLDAFVEVSKAGVCVVIATHDPSVSKRADEVWQLEDGRLTLQAS